MPLPASFQFTLYENRKTIKGDSGSTLHFVCGAGDWTACRDAFLPTVSGGGVIDASDTTLMCATVASDYLNKDPASNMFECRAEFIPAWKLASLIPNSNWRVSITRSAQCVAIKGPQAKWASGKAIENRTVTPMLSVATAQITLSGTRTTCDLSTYAAFENHVSSDSFLGGAAGMILFRGFNKTPRQLETGTMTNDVQLHLEYRAIEWNKDYNEDTGAWEVVYPDGTNPKFPSVAMSGLGTLA